MKLQFKKDPPLPPLPDIVMRNVPVHVTTEMRIGMNEQTGVPFYILKLELPTDMDGVQAILNAVRSDGSILVDVKDGEPESKN